MASQEQPRQPQQPDFVLVGGESIDQSSPSTTQQIFAHISQRLDAIDKNLHERFDSVEECLNKGVEVTAKGPGKSVDGTGKFSDDIAKRLNEIEDQVTTCHVDFRDLEKRVNGSPNAGQDSISSTNDRVDDLEMRMAKFEARQLASEANALARLLNNRCLRLDSELKPLVSIANEPMYDFPLSYGALDLLPAEKVNTLLERLGQPTEGNLAKARLRLALLAGCITVAI
ncbi:hypothetical protein F4823DRAFT_568805 [Ustulina deusta]|nr:hypothetical protein F4823DRAFT_568805 [Ustulina deusta]